MSDVNDLIAQGIRPPQVEDPLTAYGKLQQIQANRQQQQMGALEIQEKQRALAQSQAVNDAYRGALTVNPDGTPNIDAGKLSSALSAGGHGSAIPTILKGIQDYKKSSADLSEAQGKVAVLEKDAGGSLAAAVQAANNDPNTFLLMTQHAVEAKHVDAATVGPMQQQVQTAMAQDPSGNAARAMVKQITDQLLAGSPEQQKNISARISAQGTLNSGNARITEAGIAADKAPGLEAATAAETAAKTAELEKTQTQNAANQLAMAAEAEKTQPGTLDRVRFGLAQSNPPLAAKFQNAVTPADFRRIGMSPAEATTADQAAANAAQTARHNRVDEGQGAGRLAVEQGRLAMEQQQLGVSQGGQPSAAAQMAYDGRMDPGTLRAMIRKNPGLINQINAINPNGPKFDEAMIDKRYNTLKEFTDSSNAKAGGQVIALNTLVHHADLYLQTADALNNGTFVPGNQVYNAVASAFGSAPPTSANLVARFFASETGKVATGGVPAEGEVNGILKNLNSSNSPDQIKAAGQTLLQIAAGRAVPLMEKAHDANLDGVVNVMGKDAKQILANRGFDPNTMQSRAVQPPPGRGAAPPFPSLLSQSDVGKTYTNKAGVPITIKAVSPDGKSFR